MYDTYIIIAEIKSSLVHLNIEHTISNAHGKFRLFDKNQWDRESETESSYNNYEKKRNKRNQQRKDNNNNK